MDVSNACSSFSDGKEAVRTVRMFGPNDRAQIVEKSMVKVVTQMMAVW